MLPDSANVGGGTGLGGGVFSGGSGTFNMRNSLLAGNNKGDGSLDDCFLHVQAYGNNLLSSFSD